MEKSVTCFFTEKQNHLFPHMTLKYGRENLKNKQRRV